MAHRQWLIGQIHRFFTKFRQSSLKARGLPWQVIDQKSQIQWARTLSKRFIKFISIFLALILSTGTFTFFKPVKVESIGYQHYNDRTYRVEKTNQITDLLRGELIIRRQVKKIKSLESDPHRQIDLALSWVTQYVRPQDASPSPVISDDYYNILKRGSGYCDQAAYVFSVLSHRLGIPARMIMLQDRNGISHHTAAEVYLDKKWQYIDPWLGVWPHQKDGRGYSRYEFAHDQSALERFGYGPGLKGYEFSHAVIFETFPFMSFKNLIEKVLSKLGNLHESGDSKSGGLSKAALGSDTNEALSSESNAAFRTDINEGDDLTELQIKILEIYDQARALHLDQMYSEARKIYSQLIKNNELSTISDSARFFTGVTYFDQHRFVAAEKYFKNELMQHPNDLWLNSELLFLAESLIAQKKFDEAKFWLAKASSQGARVRLENLEASLKANLSTSFISY